MDLNSLTLFQAAKKRLRWLTQRQEVLSQNIANADTPRYRSRDLRGYDFREIVRRERFKMNMQVSEGKHMGGRRRRIRDFLEEKDFRPFETASAGNSVILEEQMAKVNNSSISHRLTTQLYKKHLKMFKIAIGKSN
tara:strand:+ start:473 stop:880 length:408 start_codon:yes stop_codon:yes gene_type:complete